MLLHHVCIQTDCYASSLDFYTRVLGMELLLETPDFHGRAYNSWLKLGEFHIELQTAKSGCPLTPADSNHTGLVHLCFLCDDLEETLRTFQQRGVKSFLPHGDAILYSVGGGNLFKLTAPEGTVIEFRGSATI